MPAIIRSFTRDESIRLPAAVHRPDDFLVGDGRSTYYILRRRAADPDAADLRDLDLFCRRNDGAYFLVMGQTLYAISPERYASLVEAMAVWLPQPPDSTEPEEETCPECGHRFYDEPDPTGQISVGYVVCPQCEATVRRPPT